MPRYYFHVRRGQVTVLDQEGIVLIDREEAAEEAERRAWQVQAHEVLTYLPPSKGMIIVEDDFDTVLELPFRGVPSTIRQFESAPRRMPRLSSS
jgi:hypothetical protein